MDKYKNYTVEDFLADDYFIQWLNDPEEEHEAFWTEFVAKYPKQRVNVEQAKFIVSMFQHEQEKLSLDETYDIWNDVVRSNKRSKVGRWGNGCGMQL